MTIEKCINEYGVGDVIFEEGSKGRELYVVLDGQVVADMTTAVPQSPMTLMVRGESDLGAAKPSPTAAGHLQIDWVTAYSYAGTPAVTSTSPAVVGQGANASSVLVRG